MDHFRFGINNQSLESSSRPSLAPAHHALVILASATSAHGVKIGIKPRLYLWGVTISGLAVHARWQQTRFLLCEALVEALSTLMTHSNLTIYTFSTRVGLHRILIRISMNVRFRSVSLCSSYIDQILIRISVNVQFRRPQKYIGQQVMSLVSL